MRGAATYSAANFCWIINVVQRGGPMSTKTAPLHSLDVQTADGSVSETPASIGSVPWYIWCGVVAVTSASIGGAWDVSWHRSIGRDTFWTPAHMAIYACGVLAAVACGYLIFRDDVWKFGFSEADLGEGARLSRATGSVYRRLGRDRDAHLRALRQLVACRVWAGCEDRQPAAHAAYSRNPRGCSGSAVSHSGGNESRQPGRRYWGNSLSSVCSFYSSILAA
jgi:hypothetical protein